MAVHTLCGPGTQSERLVNAITVNLLHISPEVDLPEEMGFAFMSFMKEMHSTEADEAAIQSAVNTLDDVDLGKAVDTIIEFYDSVWHFRKPD